MTSSPIGTVSLYHKYKEALWSSQTFLNGAQNSSPSSSDSLDALVGRLFVQILSEVLVEGVLGSGQVGGSLLGSDETEDDVHLLQTQTSSLGEEEGADGGDDVDTGKEEEDAAVLELQDHVGGVSGDDQVPKPLGGGGDGETVRSSSVVEDLGTVDPGDGADRETVRNDEEVDHRGHGDRGGRGLGSGRVGGWNVSIYSMKIPGRRGTHGWC